MGFDKIEMNIRIEIQYKLICYLGLNEIEAQRKVHSWSIISLKEKKVYGENMKQLSLERVQKPNSRANNAQTQSSQSLEGHPPGGSPMLPRLTLHHEAGLPAPAVGQHLPAVALPGGPGDTGHCYRHLHTWPAQPPFTLVLSFLKEAMLMSYSEKLPPWDCLAFYFLASKNLVLNLLLEFILMICKTRGDVFPVRG